jgi:aminoglycoside phosphotransferase (APT) family kinase protein
MTMPATVAMLFTPCLRQISQFDGFAIYRHATIAHVSNDDIEIQLAGGLGSGGAVVRVGDTVRRPRMPYSDAVNDFLGHLERVGFTASPRYLGIDDRERDILSWIDGDVAIPPFPRWAASDALMASVAVLQRELHQAARSYAPPAGAQWQSANLPPPEPGDIVCHNDLCLENVIVHDGAAVGFIDFEFAAPTNPLRDIAIAIRHWAPARDPQDIDPEWQHINPVERFRLYFDSYGVAAEDRQRVVQYLGEFLDQAMITMQTRAQTQPMYTAVWEAGYPHQNRRSRTWLDNHAGAIATD